METGNLDRDKEFSVVDSTEEFETQENPTSDSYEPAVTDFETEEEPVDPTSDQYSSDADITPTQPSSPQDLSEPSNTDFPASPEQEKTSSQQSFRVMRFEDFVNKGGN